MSRLLPVVIPPTADVLNFRAGQLRLRGHWAVAQSNARLQDRRTENLRTNLPQPQGGNTVA